MGMMMYMPIRLGQFTSFFGSAILRFYHIGCELRARAGSVGPHIWYSSGVSSPTWKQENSDRLRAYRREWYARNRDHAKARVSSRRVALKQWMRELKQTLKCSTCGEDHPACLQFHHKDPTQKEMSLAAALRSGWGLDKIRSEIRKCTVLCANCHFKHHYEESRTGGGYAGGSPKPADNRVRFPYVLSKKIVLRPDLRR